MVLTSPPSPRAASPVDLRALVARLRPELPVRIEPVPSEALACAFESGRSICVAGSIYLLGAVLLAIAPMKQRV
jgi:folylpolyglutamate synthase/dihydropteroate synthase